MNTQDVHTSLTLDSRNQVDKLLCQAMGMVDVLGHTDPGELAEMSLPAASWGVLDLLAKVKQLLDQGVQPE